MGIEDTILHAHFNILLFYNILIGVLADDAFGEMLRERFGDAAHVFRKYQRMMYWIPKFKNASPYPVPYDVPEDPLELALLALKRMAVDLENKITVFEVGS